MTQATVAVAVCQQYFDLDEDWPLLRDALTTRDILAQAVVWSDDDVDWASYDLVVVRGTWDYIERLEQFRTWAGRVGSATRLVNPAAVVTWNADKHYLIDLMSAGVPVVPTTWVPPSADWRAPEVEFVVKPAVSVGAFATARYLPRERAEAARHVGQLHDAGQTVMIQPYISSVEGDGETALVYLGGRFSHAVSKGPLLQPGAGVALHLGQRQAIEAVGVTVEQRQVADAALAAAATCTEPVTYARVDLFRDGGGAPLVSEIELIEPWLFLGYHHGAADRFAQVLADLL